MKEILHSSDTPEKASPELGILFESLANSRSEENTNLTVEGVLDSLADLADEAESGARKIRAYLQSE